MEDRFIHQLFAPFTRDVGNPARIRINSYEEFKSFVAQNSGKAHCFCEVYPAPYLKLSSIFYDFDGPAAYSESAAFYKYLMMDRQIPTIPLDSGKKGVHLHVFTKPHTFKDIQEAKKSLAATAVILLTEFSKKPLTSIDTHVIGDVRRFCRIPGTLRDDGNNWCTYLPPDFIHMSEEELALHRKAPHYYDYNLPIRRLEFSVVTDNFDFVSTVYSNSTPTADGLTQTQMAAATPPETKIMTYLQRVMRPCLFAAFTASNPRHHTRVASVVDLKGAGFTQREIETFIAQLHWVDYDPAVTHVQVSHIFSKSYLSYSCRTLQQLGICDGKHL
jgi:hypothetical protein